jgi:hypothetical protein
MRLIRTILLTSVGLVSCLTPAVATDFYVQAIKAGPVAGTALAIITLQASTAGTAPAPDSGNVTLLALNPTTAGKWIRPNSTSTATPTTTIPLTGTPTTTTTTAPTASATTPTTTAAAPTTTAAATAPAGATTWKSVGTLLSSGQVKGGDRIFLMDGYHGPITFRGMAFSSTVVVAPMPGKTAHVDTILIDSSKNIVFRGLKVWPLTSTNNGAIIRTYGNASDITFDQLDVRADADSANYMKWPLTTWTAKKRIGFMTQGPRNTVSNNRITGIQHGVLAMGASALVEKNIIDGFSGDGMRALGNDTIVRNNKVQNCFQIDGNHADGFQAYSVGAGGKPGTGTLMNLVVENNKFFEWTQASTSPYRCQLQGIGMFDGMYDGTRIENNSIIASAYHGITVAGALNTIIRQNTVVNSNGNGGKNPWIRVSYHKNGTAPRNVQVVNNFATNIINTTNAAQGIYFGNNLIAGVAANEFSGFTKQDLALKAGSRAIDAGDKTKTNKADILGIARWKGAAPDAGAFESF